VESSEYFQSGLAVIESRFKSGTPQIEETTNFDYTKEYNSHRTPFKA
jgi:hypothetical protein